MWPWTLTYQKFLLCISSQSQDLYSLLKPKITRRLHLLVLIWERLQTRTTTTTTPDTTVQPLGRHIANNVLANFTMYKQPYDNWCSWRDAGFTFGTVERRIRVTIETAVIRAHELTWLCRLQHPSTATESEKQQHVTHPTMAPPVFDFSSGYSTYRQQWVRILNNYCSFIKRWHDRENVTQPTTSHHNSNNRHGRSLSRVTGGGRLSPRESRCQENST